MPRPSRICSTIDCGRRHYAGGFCRRCYGEQARKDAKRKRSESWPSERLQSGQHFDRVHLADKGGVVKGPAFVRVRIGEKREVFIPLDGAS